MRSICIYLQVHQPFRVDSRTVFEGKYFGVGNKEIFEKVAKNSYQPTNKVLIDLLKRHKNFKLSLSISGVALDQMEEYSPKTLKSFRELFKTGKVEILSETYYHSLAFFYSLEEFERQVDMHRRKIKKLFGQNPIVFRNTELSYNNDLAKWAEQKSYEGILTEGWRQILKDKSPNFLYQPKGTNKIKVFLRNSRFSNDIAFRFSNKEWPGWPLTSKKFTDWVTEAKGDTINLFMDYESFGEHQQKSSGIFEFLKEIPDEITKKGWIFKTVSETIKSCEPKGEFDIPKVLTWADTERDLSAWSGNKMQRLALKAIYALEKDVLMTKNKKIIEDWRRLQTSDHFYYMCTKTHNDGGVHSYFSPYGSPYEASKAFKIALEHLKFRIDKIRKPEKK